MVAGCRLEVTDWRLEIAEESWFPLSKGELES